MEIGKWGKFIVRYITHSYKDSEHSGINKQTLIKSIMMMLYRWMNWIQWNVHISIFVLVAIISLTRTVERKWWKYVLIIYHPRKKKMKCSKFIKISLLIAKTHLQINKEGCWGSNKKPTICTSPVTFRYFFSVSFFYPLVWRFLGKTFPHFHLRQSHMLSYLASWVFFRFSF